MISAWQACQGDYKPADIFRQGDIIVISRNIRCVEGEIWQWEEYRISETDFAKITAIIDNQTNEGLFDIAELADENSNAINDLAAIIDDLNARLEILEGGENG